MQTQVQGLKLQRFKVPWLSKKVSNSSIAAACYSLPGTEIPDFEPLNAEP